MLPVMKELQKLKGVGEILSRRFIEAGYDTFAKIAAAGEEGLRKVPGVNPRMLASIVAEAKALSGEIGKGKYPENGGNEAAGSSHEGAGPGNCPQRP